MEKFATLEPVKLYSSAASTGARFLSRATGHKLAELAPPLVGRLPSDLHLLIISHLPIPDIPSYSRCCRATAAFVRDETTWEKRWKALGIDKDTAFKKVLDVLERKSNEKAVASRAAAPPVIPVDDEFGDFTVADVFGQPPPDEMGDFVGAFQNMNPVSVVSPKSPSYPPPPLKDNFRTKYIRVHSLLKPLTRLLSSAPHIVLSDLASEVTLSLYEEAKTLRLLSLFLSPAIQPVRQWDNLFSSLRTAMDRFDSSLLAAFDVADGKGDEAGMREAAESSWEVWDPSSGDWEMGKVWAEKREIFYQQGRWRALDNFTTEGQLDFGAMDEFMEVILSAIREHGARAVRVFPPASQVLLLFSERLANEVVGEYITTLLAHAREISNDIYLKSAAASFREAWKIVDAIMEVAHQRKDSNVDGNKAEDVVYQMFETNMDEYLDEEVESVKLAFDVICKGWDRESLASTPTTADGTRKFLASQNPAMLKRNVLASFTSLLLLPVTIVPRTVGVVGGALKTGGTAAVQGIAMLNPQRWGGGGGSGGGTAAPAGYSRNLEKDSGTLFEVEGEEEDDYVPTMRGAQEKKPSNNISPLPSSSSGTTHQLDLLLSLDVALEIIHADRESLKRVETFAGYPGHYGHRVRDTIEELFILMLQALGDQHVSRGFAQATERMQNYKPAEHSDTSNVAPLVQFFELVHIGDTIQSIMQVYFDKELAPHIDKTDFLNAVVREKKRFENSLDDSVATGLNAGTEVLMNQVEHIILTLTKAREYYPPEDTPLELGPTKGCQEAVLCLENHCKLLKGSTSKEVLEVFYQEVGLRLIGILQKHIKRQIISLSGGFQVIADLNAYNAFIASLRIPAISADFSHLKMLGHVYVVEDAKDLAQIVKDVARYGGEYRPEDVYEFIQRRSDWKKIEKIVDKTMYNLSFKEDCTVC
ncbi:exocyst complex component Sec10-domain-containing protein [Flammula alnicola]|nr:exocyst complex component Sec10-domain-containing protein [Flammula alnicola]